MYSLTNNFVYVILCKISSRDNIPTKQSYKNIANANVTNCAVKAM